MKKIQYIIVALLALNFQSCTDWLDLRPENEVVLEDYWQTESQVMAGLSGCYRNLSKPACTERMIVWGELRSDNLEAGNALSEDLYKIINVNITPTNSYANWQSFYAVINYCNTFLEFAPNVVNSDQNFTATKLHTLEAEALAIRALSYFYLVRAFHEVPLILEPSINDNQDYNVPKSTERKILDQLISDLLKAKTVIRSDYGKEAYNKGRITLNAVNALLADIYLWDQQYSNCVDVCNQVMADKTLKLVESDRMLNEVFNTGNSSESIFELQYDVDVQYNTAVWSFYGINNQGVGQLSYANYLAKTGDYSPFNYAASSVKESTKDIRKTNFVGIIDNNKGYNIYKYTVVRCVEDQNGVVTPSYRTSNTTPNWIIYRLSDVILMKAEALAQLNRDENDLKEALKMVNISYLRSNETADSLLFNNYNNQKSLESLVLRERQRELVFEGKRWFDLMRLVRRYNDPTTLLKYISPKLTGDNMQIKKMSIMNALYMPILESEIINNPNLIQNPFYEDSNNLTSN
jgi:starch-binding outer membrane protein, SusD/RagB family